MRLNLAKCSFEVGAGKFLGFMLTTRGIKANANKCTAILYMKSLTSLKDVQRLVGRMTTLSQFIPKLVERIRLVLKKMKKGSVDKWDADCEKAFEEVKAVLTHSLVMNRPADGKDLQIYLGGVRRGHQRRTIARKARTKTYLLHKSGPPKR
ncbi:uncharacterized protein LOC106753432 [Vigna radiata var. radiata]|uniref:Uncharacterized protein LOC106753432 n=1 Tax=Vigna radiata var. radiata TaxID=3916 RepID=A0A1S3TAD0_VIGRR|nr:uncharacterized protein LOC106753432 [Vigna radiata var. radiata]